MNPDLDRSRLLHTILRMVLSTNHRESVKKPLTMASTLLHTTRFVTNKLGLGSTSRTRKLIPSSCLAASLDCIRPLSTSTTISASNDGDGTTANIVLIGAGWWSQGWHVRYIILYYITLISSFSKVSWHVCCCE